MNKLVKNSLFQAGALATVWILASSFAGQTATAKSEARHPDLAVSQAFDLVSDTVAPRHQSAPGKGNLEVRLGACSSLAWPHIPAECLNGGKKVSRTITIEHRTGTDTSTLSRVTAEQKIALR